MTQLLFEGMEQYNRKLTKQECFDRLLEIFIEEINEEIGNGPNIEDGMPPMEAKVKFYHWIDEQVLPDFMQSVDWEGVDKQIESE